MNEYLDSIIKRDPAAKSKISIVLTYPGVKSVFFGPNFVTITKEENTEWESINQDIISIFDKL